MPGRKHIWVSDAAQQHLAALQERWGLSASAAIARALERAESELASDRTEEDTR